MRTNYDTVDIAYTNYNPLSGYSMTPEIQWFYYLVNPSAGNKWTITVTPGQTVILYFVLIAPPGSAGSSSNGCTPGGGSTGGIGGGSITFNSTTVLNLTLDIGYSSLSFGDSEFFYVECGNPGSDQYETENPGGNGTSYWLNKDLSTPAIVTCSFWGSAGGVILMMMVMVQKDKMERIMAKMSQLALMVWLLTLQHLWQMARLLMRMLEWEVTRPLHQIAKLQLVDHKCKRCFIIVHKFNVYFYYKHTLI